jgi:UDP-2-acetamido-3-amino-2,3-dideoxy-glucuronate N-acetyltransferase
MTKNYTSDLALIGAGYWGKNLARNFHALGALHTLCDTNSEILASYGSDYDSIVKSNDFDSVLAQKEIRKIVIAAPANLHYRLAKKALQAGKDVFCEKPLCLDTVQAEELISLAESECCILMVGHLLQYHPCVNRLFEIAHSGTLGRLLYITSNRLNLGKIRREENSLWSFAPHDISVISKLAGGLPLNVVCHGQTNLTHGVADTTITQMQFAGGLRAHVYVSWLNPFKEQKLTVVGSQGMAVFDDTLDWEDKLVLYTDYLTWTEGNIPNAKKCKGQPIQVDRSEPLECECKHFLDSCRDRSQPRTDGKEGLRVLKILNAAQKSLDENGSVQTIQVAAPAEYFAHKTAIIDPLAKIGKGSKIWHYCHVSDHSELGDRCNLGQNVFIASSVRIGNNVKIQNNVSVYAGALIEDDVFLGPSCVFTNVSNPRSAVNRRGVYESTILRRGATVGANATIVCGIEIGRYAFIAAGAVVTRSVPDFALVAGVPASILGWMSQDGYRLCFDGDMAHCVEENATYKLAADGQSVHRVGQ